MTGRRLATALCTTAIITALAGCDHDAPAARPSADATAAMDSDRDVVILDDPFNDDTHGWGGDFQRFDRGSYVWTMPAGQTDARAANTLIAIEGQITSSTTSTTFTAQGAAAVGIDCATHDTEGRADFYQLVLTRAGAEIRKRSFGDVPDLVLTHAATPTLHDGEDVRLDATCTTSGDAYTLALDVDGERVLETVDETDPLGAGAPGLLVEAAASPIAPNGAIVRFDSFTVHGPTGSPTAR